MKFLRENTTVATRAIAGAICDGLHKNERVLWLISGGSNIAIEKGVMDLVLKHAADETKGLAILPIDERYGLQGHIDSNIAQLENAGITAGDAIIIDVLLHNVSFEQTVDFYTAVASTAFANADIVIGEFGMGPDGHVAGIKPNSPATEPNGSLVIGYEWDDYARMTLMPEALKQITKAFVTTYGKSRKAPLVHLQKRDQSFKQLPAMLLYDLTDVRVYNDQVGNGGKK